MQSLQLLLKLRIKWFNLTAKNFILRYQNGLFVIVLFLPGVAVGDNLNLLFKALTTPFLNITNPENTITSRLIWFLVLQAIFVVFSRAQKTAITGGEFTKLLQSLPIDNGTNNKINLTLLLLANHFLWMIVMASFYYQLKSDSDINLLNLCSNLMLIFILLTTQYIAVFKWSLMNSVLLMLISALYLVSASLSMNYFGMFITATMWFLLAVKLSKPDIISIKITAMKPHITGLIKYNLYYQILFKATATASMFRFLFVCFLVIGFSLISQHLSNINEGNLFPYVMGFESLLAYYLSGFYVSFKDQRLRMDKLLMSLPVSKTFWLLRDVFTVIIISLVLHFILYYLIVDVIGLTQLTELMIYHIVVLTICYPLRVLIKQNQTLITFAVLSTITAITLYNYS